jgi:hypothetical protein
VWEGAVTSHGYGEFIYNGVNERAHKLAWLFTHGSLPEGLKEMKVVLMHSCDNKWCVNPGHLSIGTQKENIQDMFRKGRDRNWRRLRAT